MARVFQGWIVSTGRTGCLRSPARERLILRRLREGYSESDLLDAVDGWRCVAFNRGENADHRVWNDLELLLRDAQHIERFRDAKRGGETSVALSVIPLRRPNPISQRIQATLARGSA